MEYDEQDAVNYIINKVGSDIDEDDILNIIDIIWDYYEDNGMLEISADLETDSQSLVKDLISHVIEIISKDKSQTLTADVISKIILAELEYEESLEIY